jgi:co-chaperonin GroES (HSP10)
MAAKKAVLSTKARKVRRLNPLGFRVVVQLIKDANQTEAGLYLPEGAKESMDEAVLGEVVEVASAIDDETSEEANVSGIPMGARVLIPRKAGTRIPWDESLRIVETKEILAIVFESEIS